MKTRTRTRSAPGPQRRSQRPRGSHRQVTHDPTSTQHLSQSRDKSFIDWDLVSINEAATNNRAPLGRHIGAAFHVPDHLGIDQVLLNVDTRHSRTTIRTLKPAEVSS